MLTLQKQMPDPPANISTVEWRDWVKSQPKCYQIEKTEGWWRHVWPKIIRETNIALAKHQSSVVIKDSRIWVRIREEDIIINIYSTDAYQHKDDFDKALYPYHPGCLTDFAKLPVQWWNENIDHITEHVDLIIGHT